MPDNELLFSSQPSRTRDDNQPMVLLRENVTAADAAVRLDPQYYDSPAIKLIDVQDRQMVGLVPVAVGSNDGTFILSVVGLFKKRQTDADGNVYFNSAPMLLHETTVTLGTATQDGVNPISGKQVPSTTWRFADTFTASTGDGATNGPGTNFVYHNASGANRQAWMEIDTAGRSKLAVFLTSLSNVTRMDIGVFGLG